MKTNLIALAVVCFASAALPSAHAAGKDAKDGLPKETLPSGVKVEHKVIGKGAMPTAADTVKVNYRGTLADGTEFDASAKHGGPATFPLSRVVPCWTQGVQKIKVGGKATLTCPPDTAYGANGVPGVIPPNATLTFEVELVSIEK